MKMKAVATATLPKRLLDALDSRYVADAFRDDICVPHLHVPRENFGPATHYVQVTDLTLPSSDDTWGVEVTLSKVSVTDERSHNDFLRALAAVEALYVKLIRENLEVGRKAQLFCVLAIDQAISFSGQPPTSLPERDPIWVEGTLPKQD